jgi:F-type H+-transporting ATPase subunit delta
MATAVANRYARALVELVLAPGSSLKPEDAVAQLRAVEQMISESWELRNAMLTPAIQTSRKRAVMAELLKKLQASDLTRNFVYVVIDHRRIGMMSEIREAFELQLDERLGFVRAEVTSAQALATLQHDNIEGELSRLTGKRMRLRFDVDAELIGGVTARIGSTVYDGSVRGQLQRMRREFTGQIAE